MHQPLLQKASRRRVHFVLALLILVTFVVVVTAVSRQVLHLIAHETSVGGNLLPKNVNEDSGATSGPQFPPAAAMNEGAAPAPAEAGPSVSNLAIDRPRNSPYVERRTPQGSPNLSKRTTNPWVSQAPKRSSQAGTSALSDASDSSESGLVIAQSEMGPIRVDRSLRPYFATGPADCNDPVVGFEAMVMPCKNVRMHYIFLTPNRRTYVPMIIDSSAKCQTKECAARDKISCCIRKQQCRPFLVDVPGGCPADHVPNVYPHAFCSSNPCRPQDSTACCIKASEVHNRQFNQQYTLVKNLQVRKDDSRSKQARISPDDTAEFVEPHISFAYGEMAWIDNDRRTRGPNGDIYAPLINFMAAWGPEYGWKTDAWIKVKKGRNFEKYNAYQMGESSPLDPGRMMEQVIIADQN